MHWIFFTYGMKKIQRMAAGSRPTETSASVCIQF
jgi:hypothetical protein